MDRSVFLATLYDFADGNVDFPSFRDWFAEVLPECDESDDRFVAAITARLRLLFAEYGRGHREISEMRTEVRSLLPARSPATPVVDAVTVLRGNLAVSTESGLTVVGGPSFQSDDSVHVEAAGLSLVS